MYDRESSSEFDRPLRALRQSVKRFATRTQVQRDALIRIKPVFFVCPSLDSAPFPKLRIVAKFGGMDVSDAKGLKELEGENAKLKKLLAEAHLDMHALKSVLGVKR